MIKRIASTAVSLMCTASASAQPLDLSVIPGVPGQVDSEFSQLVCYDWTLGQPVSFACPPNEAPQAQATQGCLELTVDMLPATSLTLRGFEATFAPTPTQVTTYFGQGSLSHTFGETTVRMVPESGPFVGVFDPSISAFAIDAVPIEAEGQIVVAGTGIVGAAFPLAVLDLADFTFPPAQVFVASLTSPDGDIGFALSGLLGAPLFEPGGRLDVGSGFVVGLGGGVLLNAVADGPSCGAEPCLADTNGDGQANPADFNAWVIAFNNQAPECDQNGDGLCNPADFNAWVINFNGGC